MLKTYWALHICLIFMQATHLNAIGGIPESLAKTAINNVVIKTVNFLSKLLHIDSKSEKNGNLYGLNLILLKNERGQKNPENVRPWGKETSVYRPILGPGFSYDGQANRGFTNVGYDCKLGEGCTPLYFSKKRRAQRRQNAGIVLRRPEYPEDLPAAEPILPGHTLLRPASGMLKSAVKYPLRDVEGAAVYGNLENVGITWGKTNNRIRYSDFRKHNNLMRTVRNSMKNRNTWNRERFKPMIVIELEPSELGLIKRDSNLSGQKITDTPSTEIIDDIDALFEKDDTDVLDLRRKRSKSKFRNREKLYARSKDNSDTSKESDELEKNPGNPFTIYKNKYRQNWLWNHEMDGDHMNINPHAPSMDVAGPSGAELFFGRKWWYFNQDDYLPLRR